MKFKQIDWIICNDKDQFLDNINSWQKAWEISFKRKLIKDILEKYFLSTPHGSPIVIIGKNKNEVVASSTLIPLYLRDPISLKKINYFHLLASFIIPGFSNGFQTYYEMINLVKSQFLESNYDFILTFPNEKAKLPLITLGHFKLIDVGYFIKHSLDKEFINIFMKELEKPFFDEKLYLWRTNKNIFNKKGQVYKKYNNEINLLDMVSESFSKNFNGILPWWESWGKISKKPLNNYYVNMCVFSKKKLPNIKRSFLLSDIF